VLVGDVDLLLVDIFVCDVVVGAIVSCKVVVSCAVDVDAVDVDVVIVHHGSSSSRTHSASVNVPQKHFDAQVVL